MVHIMIGAIAQNEIPMLCSVALRWHCLTIDDFSIEKLEIGARIWNGRGKDAGVCQPRFQLHDTWLHRRLF